MEGINTDNNKTLERLVDKNEDIKNVIIPDIAKSPEEQISSISNEINKEENTIISTKNSIDKIRQELGLVGEETNIPSIEFNKNKKSNLEKTLSTISSSVSSFAKVATVSAGLFAGGNNLEANNIKQNQGDKFVQGMENVSSIEDDKGKIINGGNLEEVVVYGKKKYEEELFKQEVNIKKFEAEMAKYQKDSAEWIKANEAYQDSLKLYGTSKKQLDKMMGMVDFIDDDGKTRLTAEEVQKNIKGIDPKWKDTFGQVEYGDFRSVADDYKGHAYAVMPNMKMSKDGQLQMNKSADNKSWASENREEAKDFINKTEKNEIKPKFAPILFFGDSYDPNNQNYNYRAVYAKPKGTKMTKPEKPENLKTKEVKYDPKFEDLQMRSLWATILKQDPNAKIGTLHLLDPQFKEGFTLEEAMTFPQEIKDRYNIDYIYNQIHSKDESSGGDYKHPGWDYNNPAK